MQGFFVLPCVLTVCFFKYSRFIHAFINFALYISHLFEFRICLLLASDIRERHPLCSNAQGCHQRGS